MSTNYIVKPYILWFHYINNFYISSLLFSESNRCVHTESLFYMTTIIC